MAAHTVLATVSCSVKLLLKANRKKANTACWIAGCCTGKGECLHLTGVRYISHQNCLETHLTSMITCLFLGLVIIRQNSFGD